MFYSGEDISYNGCFSERIWGIFAGVSIEFSLFVVMANGCSSRYAFYDTLFTHSCSINMLCYAKV